MYPSGKLLRLSKGDEMFAVGQKVKMKDRFQGD